MKKSLENISIGPKRKSLYNSKIKFKSRDTSPKNPKKRGKTKDKAQNTVRGKQKAPKGLEKGIRNSGIANRKSINAHKFSTKTSKVYKNGKKKSKGAKGRLKTNRTPHKQISSKNLKYLKQSQNKFILDAKAEKGDKSKLSEKEGKAERNLDGLKKEKNSNEIIKEIMKRIQTNESNHDDLIDLKNIDKNSIYDILKNETRKSRMGLIKNGSLQHRSEDENLLFNTHKERFFLSEKKANHSQELSKGSQMLRSLKTKQILEIKSLKEKHYSKNLISISANKSMRNEEGERLLYNSSYSPNLEDNLEKFDGNKQRYSKVNFPLKKTTSSNEFSLVSKLSDRWKRNLLKKKEITIEVSDERGALSVERKEKTRLEIKGNRFLSPEYTRKHMMFKNKNNTLMSSETPKNPSNYKFKKTGKLNKNQSDNLKTRDNLFFPIGEQDGVAFKKNSGQIEGVVEAKKKPLDKKRKKKEKVIASKANHFYSDHASSKEFNSKSLTKIWLADLNKNSKMGKFKSEKNHLFPGSVNNLEKEPLVKEAVNNESMQLSSHKKYFKVEKKKKKSKKKRSNRTQPPEDTKIDYLKTKSVFKKQRKRKQQKSIGAVSNTITTLKSNRKYRPREKSKKSRKFAGKLDPQKIFIGDSRRDPKSPQSMFYKPEFAEDSEVFYKDSSKFTKDDCFKSDNHRKSEKVGPRRSINFPKKRHKLDKVKRSKKSEFIRVKNFHKFGESQEEDHSPNREVKSVIITQIFDNCSADEFTKSEFRNLDEEDGSVLYNDMTDNDQYGSVDFEGKGGKAQVFKVAEIFSLSKNKRRGFDDYNHTEAEDSKVDTLQKISPLSQENSPKKLKNIRKIANKKSFEEYKKSKEIEKVEKSYKKFLNKLRSMVARFELRISEKPSKKLDHFQRKKQKSSNVITPNGKRSTTQIDVYSLHNQNKSNGSKNYGSMVDLMYDNTVLKLKMRMHGLKSLARVLVRKHNKELLRAFLMIDRDRLCKSGG